MIKHKDILDENGFPLNAAFSVEDDGDEYSIYFESRGGDRNVDYIPGLELVLARLRRLDATVQKILLASTVAARLPEERTRINVAGVNYPQRLRELDDTATFRRRLSAAQAQIARAENAGANGGNPTRRLRIVVSIPAEEWTETRLAEILRSDHVQVLSPDDLPSFLSLLNARAADSAIGELQRIRARLHHTRVASRKIFREDIGDDDWACHYGGRKELQFNVGFDFDIQQKLPIFRHGVAFSLETSRTLPDIRVLFPKILRFNDFIRNNPDYVSDMEMWYWRLKKHRSVSFAPRPISSELMENNTFIFLGRAQSPEKVNLDLVLRDFDRLLSLYRFVEDDHAVDYFVEPPTSVPVLEVDWQFEAIGQRMGGEYAIRLRHKQIQIELARALERETGVSEVCLELPTGQGTSIDVAARRSRGWSYYEVKTALTVRGCIREGLSQLLEYAYWGADRRVERLIIVGEHPVSEAADAYLTSLRQQFSLPLYYECWDSTAKRLVRTQPH